MFNTELKHNEKTKLKLWSHGVLRMQTIGQIIYILIMYWNLYVAAMLCTKVVHQDNHK